MKPSTTSQPRAGAGRCTTTKGSERNQVGERGGERGESLKKVHVFVWVYGQALLCVCVCERDIIGRSEKGAIAKERSVCRVVAKRVHERARHGEREADRNRTRA